MPPRDVVFPAGRQALYAHHRYSPAVRAEGFLFVSGQVGSREDGSPEPDFEAQVRLAFANLQATLRAAGCSLDDIVDVTTFHTDPERQFDSERRKLCQPSLSELDGHRCELACRFRFRDQGRRPAPAHRLRAQSASAASTAALACRAVVSNSGTRASCGPTSRLISVQPRMMASAPRATS